MRLYALVEAGDPEAIDVYLCKQDAQWGARGKPQGARNMLRTVQAAAKAAKLNGGDREPVGVHDLRHGFVAVALASGVSPAEAASLARHANARVTARGNRGNSRNT